MVGFDSIIPPGREGTVTEEVNIANMHSGSFSKSATITSNAKNSPSLQISMRGTIKEAVSISPDYIQLSRDKNGKFESQIMITTEKADLKIQEIAFKSNQTPSNKSPVWQKDIPIPLDYSITKDTVIKKPDHVYTVKIALNYPDSVNNSGEFIIKTNNPDMPEFKASGTINAGK